MSWTDETTNGEDETTCAPTGELYCGYKSLSTKKMMTWGGDQQHECGGFFIGMMFA
jgi:hypothetical protein